MNEVKSIKCVRFVVTFFCNFMYLKPKSVCSNHKSMCPDHKFVCLDLNDLTHNSS